MSLPHAVTRHHTAWVGCDHCEPRPVRYTVDDDRIVCFGDELPADAVDGQRVFITVHEIAGGPPLATLSGTVEDLDGACTDANTVLDLLEHVSLGATMADVERSLAQQRTRRLVAVRS
jgi:hypothetical protein